MRTHATPPIMHSGKLRRFTVLLLATIAGIGGFVAGDLFLSGRSGLPPVANWSIAQHRVLVITFVMGLFVPALILEFYGAALAGRTCSALKRLRACARKRWKRDRTREEFQRAEIGFCISVVVTLCIAVLFFMPLAAFTILMMCVALSIQGYIIVSACRYTRFNPVWATLILAFYGAVVGYGVGW